MINLFFVSYSQRSDHLLQFARANLHSISATVGTTHKRVTNRTNIAHISCDVRNDLRNKLTTTADAIDRIAWSNRNIFIGCQDVSATPRYWSSDELRRIVRDVRHRATDGAVAQYIVYVLYMIVWCFRVARDWFRIRHSRYVFTTWRFYWVNWTLISYICMYFKKRGQETDYKVMSIEMQPHFQNDANFKVKQKICPILNVNRCKTLNKWISHIGNLSEMCLCDWPLWDSMWKKSIINPFNRHHILK